MKKQDSQLTHRIHFRLLSGFALMLFITFCICAAYFSSFSSVKFNLDQKISPNIDAALQTIQLTEVTQKLIHHVPRIAIAESQQHLMKETLGFLDTHDELNRMLKGFLEQPLLQQPVATMIESAKNIESLVRQLDLLMAQKISSQLYIDRIESNYARVLQQLEQDVESANKEDYYRWSKSMREVERALLSLSVEHNPAAAVSRYQALRKELNHAYELIKAARFSSQKKNQQAILMQQRLLDLVVGPTGILAQQTQLYQLKEDIRETLSKEKQLANVLNQSAQLLVDSVRQQVVISKQNTITQLTQMFMIILGLVFSGCVAVTVIVVYLQRSVMQRLTKVRGNMLNYISSRAAPEDVKGDDELTDMHKALTKLIHQVEEREHQLEALATTDSLTNALNRRCLLEHAQKEVELHLRDQLPFSLFIMDIDFFKKVNDTYGHAAGDQVLIEVTESCQSMLRKIDAFGRWGGEEFVGLLHNTPLDEAWQVTERIRKHLEELQIYFEGQTLQITASFGVAQVMLNVESVEAAIERADQALYIAKEEGRNFVKKSIA
ncbi:GGDEF domain-containing protein [Pleionea sp. CnH1-48]|uniref:GGDEF domain-containing protein n=1 Tax=Pleionea sp. CnH1-48 TaxID=2954494 RepID=UPI002097AA9C|nr:GGDEF domain-containing protein [Pleionea sp. CnH1-48]MCO7224170.1 GGDEF domain-containing protein [Pleionea sp. CnH1-48]